MTTLSKKKILFFAPKFFGYENEITSKFLEYGADVDFFNERSINKAYQLALLKYFPFIFNKITKKYYNSIINKIQNKEYDYILVIKCEMMPTYIIKKLKTLYPKAIFSLYLYDSIKNIKGIRNKIDLFDRVLTFDKTDSENFPQLIHRPLFYADKFKKDENTIAEIEYDLCFIGSIHSDRYKIIKSIMDITKKYDLKAFFHCYIQSKVIYFLYVIFKREFKLMKINEFRFNKLSFSEISKIILKSEVILDIQHPKQSGLTMRTIEMIGMNKKIITTNKKIKEYEFYNEQNILVIDRKEVVIPKTFFNKQYIEIDSKILKKYSLDYWIFDVLGIAYKGGDCIVK